MTQRIRNYKLIVHVRQILVTGADGFIGSHLVEYLARAGHQVRVFVFCNSFDSWGWLDHAEPAVRDSLDVFAGDIRDPHGVKQAMKGSVIPCRALQYVQYGTELLEAGL